MVLAEDYITYPSYSLSQVNSNCPSFQLAEGFDGDNPHEVFTSFTRTLSIHDKGDVSNSLMAQEEEDHVSFMVVFTSENEKSVEFQASILGERLAEKYQVREALWIKCNVY